MSRVSKLDIFIPPGDCLGSAIFFPSKLGTPTDVTGAGEKFDILMPPGRCLRSDTAFPLKIGNRPMMSLSRVSKSDI